MEEDRAGAHPRGSVTRGRPKYAREKESCAETTVSERVAGRAPYRQ